MKLNIDISVEEILKIDNAFDVFKSFGFEGESKEDLISILGKRTKVSTILKLRGISFKVFTGMLEDEDYVEEKDFNDVYHNPDEKLDFLGSVICPLKKPFKEDLSEILEEYKAKTGKSFNCYIADGHGAETDLYPDFWKETDIDKFPDIVMSKGIDDMYRKELFDNLVSKGYFTSVNTENIDKKFLDAGCLDDSYTMYGSFLDVLVIDMKKMGDLPIPRVWNDLLNPIYKDSIITFEKSGEVSTAIPLYYYKEHGDEGVRKFARNVKDLAHGAKMTHILGSKSEESAPIFTMPFAFAKSCLKKDTVLIVPDDGAIMYPFCMLIKKGKEEEMKPIIDYIFKIYGENLSKSNALSLSPEIKNKVLDEINIKWIGWDFIKANDMIDLNEHIIKVFNEEVELKKRGN